jgi:hypothetical protein
VAGSPTGVTQPHDIILYRWAFVKENFVKISRRARKERRERQRQHYELKPKTFRAELAKNAKRGRKAFLAELAKNAEKGKDNIMN